MFAIRQWILRAMCPRRSRAKKLQTQTRDMGPHLKALATYRKKFAASWKACGQAKGKAKSPDTNDWERLIVRKYLKKAHETMIQVLKHIKRLKAE